MALQLGGLRQHALAEDSLAHISDDDLKALALLSIEK